MMLFVSIVAVGMVSCGDDNEGKPDFTADYPELAPVNGKIVISAYFGEAPCNKVVFAGSYNGWKGTNAGDDVNELVEFKPVGTVDGKDWVGWYKVEIDTTGASAEKEGTKYLLAGKPVQLKADGSFSWDHQIGYQSATNVVVKSGDVGVFAGYSNECDVYYNSPVASITFAQWKKNPCAVVVKHNYTFSVTVPTGTPDTAKVSIVGGFEAAGLPNWTPDAASMVLTKGGDGKYSITLNQVPEGTEYKYVLNGSWDYEELAASDSTCAVGITNRITGTSATVNDVVANWKGATISKCE